VRKTHQSFTGSSYVGIRWGPPPLKRRDRKQLTWTWWRKIAAGAQNRGWQSLARATGERICRMRRILFTNSELVSLLHCIALSALRSYRYAFEILIQLMDLWFFCVSVENSELWRKTPHLYEIDDKASSRFIRERMSDVSWMQFPLKKFRDNVFVSFSSYTLKKKLHFNKYLFEYYNSKQRFTKCKYIYLI